MIVPNDNIGQIEVADKIEIVQSYYSDTEKGKKKPSIKIAMKIAEEFNINWTEIY